MFDFSSLNICDQGQLNKYKAFDNITDKHTNIMFESSKLNSNTPMPIINTLLFNMLYSGLT